MADEFDFLNGQEKELVAFADSKVSFFLNLIEDARKEIKKELLLLDGVTRANFLKMVQQLDEIEADLIKEIKRLGSDAFGRSLTELAVRHTNEVLEFEGVGSLVIDFPQVNRKTLAVIAEAPLDKITSIGSERITVLKRELFNSIGVKGENVRKLARRLTGPEGVFTEHYHIVENVVRTETNRIYNVQTEEAIEVANVRSEAGLNRRISETIDSKRNHPISLVINNMVQALGKPFRVKESDVVAAAARLKKSYSPKSIFWILENGYFVGKTLPAHYRERGRVIPTRKPVNVD